MTSCTNRSVPRTSVPDPAQVPTMGFGTGGDLSNSFSHAIGREGSALAGCHRYRAIDHDR